MKNLQGIVILSNSLLGLYAVNMFEKDISIIKKHGDAVLNIGDLITGDLDNPKAVFCYNETRREEIEISVEHVHCSIDDALYRMGLK